MFSDYRAFGFCEKSMLQTAESLALQNTSAGGGNFPKDLAVTPSAKETALLVCLEDTTYTNLTLSFDKNLSGDSPYSGTFKAGAQIAGALSFTVTTGKVLAYIQKS